jgi:dTDP-4-amino-4,6-dideoxygalactose transaminase
MSETIVPKPIEFLNLTHYFEKNKATYLKTFENFMERGQFILGEQVKHFELEFAQYLGAQHAVGVSNGLDALTLCLRACGVGPGDEVIVPAHTFIATWLSVTSVGARPVPVDVDSTTMNISLKEVEKAATQKTKAVIGVHLYGRPFDGSALRLLCENLKVFLIEDAAQAHGAAHGPHRVGTIGHLAAFSFYPGKNLGAFGDAGAITSNCKELIEKIICLRNYGSRKKYHHELLGYNFRLDELQAALLRLKLPALSAENEHRRKLAQVYRDGLADLSNLWLPEVNENESHVWHLYTVRTSKRDELQSFLAENNIQTLIHYPVPPHLSEAYASFRFKKGDFPITEEICRTVLSLPLGPHLTPAAINYVVERIRSFFSSC